MVGLSAPGPVGRWGAAPPQAMLERMKDYGQEGAFALWDDLSPEDRELLVRDIEVRQQCALGSGCAGPKDLVFSFCINLFITGYEFCVTAWFCVGVHAYRFRSKLEFFRNVLLIWFQAVKLILLDKMIRCTNSFSMCFWAIPSSTNVLEPFLVLSAEGSLQHFSSFILPL